MKSQKLFNDVYYVYKDILKDIKFPRQYCEVLVGNGVSQFRVMMNDDRENDKVFNPEEFIKYVESLSGSN